MTNKCTITLSNEQYILLMDTMKFAIGQHRHRLGEIYSGKPFHGGEMAVRMMEEKVSNIVELHKSLLEVKDDCTDVLLYDEDDAAEFINAETGIDMDVIEKVINAEMKYMESIGIAEKEGE